MKYYVNVTFNENGKKYFFSTDDQTLKLGDFVVVDTVVGREIGTVSSVPLEVNPDEIKFELKPILRKANDFDLKCREENIEDAKDAKVLFTKSVANLKLEMDLIDAEYTLDRSKLLFTYIANARVDFRELLRVLASALHCRIELRQINARERAQSIGGIGICGLPLCCTTFLKEFEGVSLNKAKNQMLAINIPKISGQCGKLMCCLKFEDDDYTEEKKKYPHIGAPVKYNGSDFKVDGFNILSQTIKLKNEDAIEIITLEKFNELTNPNYRPRPQNVPSNNYPQKANNQNNDNKTYKQTQQQNTQQKSNNYQQNNRNNNNYDANKKAHGNRKDNYLNNKHKNQHQNQDQNQNRPQNDGQKNNQSNGNNYNHGFNGSPNINKDKGNNK
jgi:cell fate regulator YaaT (PSP1 superfamily)